MGTELRVNPGWILYSGHKHRLSVLATVMGTAATGRQHEGQRKVGEYLCCTAEKVVVGG